MKRMFFLVAVFVVFGIAPAAFAQAEIDCETIQACTFTGERCEAGEARTCPAILFQVTQAGSADITFRAVKGFDCPEGGEPQTGTVDLPQTGLAGVFLNFSMPPPDGFQYSVYWEPANCTGDNGLCGSYTFGSPEPDCNDLIGGSITEASFIELLPQ